jgi:hypothetical protein
MHAIKDGKAPLVMYLSKPLFLNRQGARPILTVEEKLRLDSAELLPPLQTTHKGEEHGKTSSNIF